MNKRKTVGFLGCGKIGKAMVRHLLAHSDHDIGFVQDPNFVNDVGLDCPVVARFDATVCVADVVVECATADVLKENYAHYLPVSDLIVFSMSAFSDSDFEKAAIEVSRSSGSRIYLPHGAILGLDGIFDAREILSTVEIETIKGPKTLGCRDKKYAVVFEGNARGAVQMFPRNANVHAAIAIAGIGFDRTQSRIISDPEARTNSHKIHVCGDGIEFTLNISAQATGGVTGSYVPISACGSLDRVLGRDTNCVFV